MKLELQISTYEGMKGISWVENTPKCRIADVFKDEQI